MGKMVNVTIDLDRVVKITENHGGYYAGECTACGASGWLAEARHGYPHGSQVGKEKGNGLNHTKECSVNALLNDDGTVK